MEKYISSIKDLVIQTITNGSEIKSKANSGDSMGCFQMGMIHLLGINTPVDFKKANQFFSNQSLSDNQNAIRLLGFQKQEQVLRSQQYVMMSNLVLRLQNACMMQKTSFLLFNGLRKEA